MGGPRQESALWLYGWSLPKLERRRAALSCLEFPGASMTAVPSVQNYDVLVVGSGFGGSVAALRLTEKGYRVGVLEAGRRFADEELAKTSWDVRRFLWAPKLGCTGIQRIHRLNDVIVLAGAGVGGGSLVYANTLYEPESDGYYRRPHWAHITDWRDELAPFYDQARRMLGVVINPTMTAADVVYRKVADEMGVGHTFAGPRSACTSDATAPRSPASRSMIRSSAASGRGAPGAWSAASA